MRMAPTNGVVGERKLSVCCDAAAWQGQSHVDEINIRQIVGMRQHAADICTHGTQDGSRAH